MRGSPSAHICLRAQQWSLKAGSARSQGHLGCPLHLGEEVSKVRGVTGARTQDSTPLRVLRLCGPLLVIRCFQTLGLRGELGHVS